VNDPEKLENFIREALTALPDRRAPLTLETRVLAEIGRRSALPWWRQSHAHWPAAARGAFFVISAAAAAILVAGLLSVANSAGAAAVAATAARRFAWMGFARDAVATATGDLGAFFLSIPQTWLYGALAVAGAGYAALIGVGAAVYRTLSARR
jgi:hypothetical protein